MSMTDMGRSAIVLMLLLLAFFRIGNCYGSGLQVFHAESIIVTRRVSVGVGHFDQYANRLVYPHESSELLLSDVGGGRGRGIVDLGRREIATVTSVAALVRGFE